MRYLAGYIGCAGIFLLLMGLVFNAFVLPTIRPRKRHFLEWLMIAVFGFGMYNSMATKPGSGDPSPGPRGSPPRQAPASPPEHGLAFVRIEKSPTNVLLTAAWPLGFFDYAPTFDLFIAKPQLTNDWQWIASQSAAATATNCTFTVTPSLLGLAELPSSLFAHMTERREACKTMNDPDADGVPSPFELYHGTNPYVPDAHLIQTLDCTNTDFTTLKSALANSTEYSIINLPTGTIAATDTILMPPHPVLLSGPKDGYTVIELTGGKGAFRFEDGQDSHTLIRNVYLNLLKRGGFQVGFWSGGNLPWEGIGASPSFENVVIRMPRPEPLYIGWLYYRDNGDASKLTNCVVNALGATNVRGVETGNGPRVNLADCSFLNFPSNGFQTLSRTYAHGNDGTTNTVVRRGGEATVFVDLTPGVDSDGDGYTNLEEVETHGTDPWLADTDGDGMSDPEEIAIGTDPSNVHSFRQTIFIRVTNGTDIANSSIYVSWRCEDGDAISTPITNSAARSFDILLPRPEAQGRIVIRAFHDMDGNGAFDADHDIELTKPAALFGEVSRISFAFGDVDGDGVGDLQELLDGTDPYSANSIRITRTVILENRDYVLGITNYVSQGLAKGWCADEPFHRMTGLSETLPIATNAVNGCVFVKCYRDFNCNGVYDKDCEPLYVYSVSNKDNPNETVFPATFGDKDGDGVADSAEWSEGTDLNSHLSYCYTPRITVTGIFSTTNQLLAQPFFGTNALAAAHVVCTNQEEYCFGHFRTSASERLTVKYWDDLNGNLVPDDGEPFSTASVKPDGHETSLVYDLPYSKFDADSNRLPDWWEIATGLSTNSAPYDYYTDTDNDGLINLHEYWTGCDPLVPDGSNTVLSILARSIDDRLTDDPTGRMNVYNNYCDPDFYPNTNCWAYGINFTSASPYNNNAGTNKAGTAISPQHILLASHYPYGSNTIVVFKDHTHQTITRTVIDSIGVSGTDLFICLLNTPLPATITPASILPPNYAQYIGNGNGLPILQFDQEEHAIVADLTALPQKKEFSQGAIPTTGKRRLYFESMISGDSGDPAFLVFDKSVIILHVFYFGGGGGGPFTAQYADSIQSAMNTLSNRRSQPSYALQYFDFSSHPTIIREAK